MPGPVGRDAPVGIHLVIATNLWPVPVTTPTLQMRTLRPREIQGRAGTRIRDCARGIWNLVLVKLCQVHELMPTANHT
jgi:hypothetical protein